MTIEVLWEKLLHWLQQRPFGGDVTVMHIAIALLVGYAAIVVVRKVAFSKLDKGSHEPKHMQCTSCGWQGQFQLAIKQCPHCGKRTMQRTD